MPLFKITSVVNTRQVFSIYVDAPNEAAASHWSGTFDDEATVGRCVDEKFSSEVSAIEPAKDLPKGFQFNSSVLAE